MSSITHSNQVFLGLPLPALPSTFKSSMHFLTHSSLFRSTCPNHLSLPHLTASDTQSIPSLPLSSSFDRCFFIETPHICRAMLASALINFCVSSTLSAHVSLPYIITLRTQALYNFPFNFKEVALAVMMGASSLNLPHARLTRHRTA